MLSEERENVKKVQRVDAMKVKILPYKEYLVPIARKLRKRMTPGEVVLWQHIRKRPLGYQFHRQVPIDQFIVDFYCHELMLAIEIEIDGAAHDFPEASVSDLNRQRKLESMGVQFLRFEEKEIIKNVDSVTDIISNWIEQHERGKEA